MPQEDREYYSKIPHSFVAAHPHIFMGGMSQVLACSAHQSSRKAASISFFERPAIDSKVNGKRNTRQRFCQFARTFFEEKHDVVI